MLLIRALFETHADFIEYRSCKCLLNKYLRTRQRIITKHNNNTFITLHSERVNR